MTFRESSAIVISERFHFLAYKKCEQYLTLCQSFLVRESIGKKKSPTKVDKKAVKISNSTMIAISRQSEQLRAKPGDLTQFFTVGSFVMGTIHLAMDYPPLWGVLGLYGGYLALTEGQMKGKIPNKVVLGGLALLAVPVFIALWETPSHAILLSGAQTHFTTLVGAGGGDGQTYTNFINLIFNTARGIYLILLAKAGWDGYQDYRQNEEFGTYVRVMAGTLFGVLMIDAITPYVVGGGTTTTT